MMFEEEFYPPPECPVFEPNEEEFADPLGYINKIRPIAERYGICKIRPPPHWQPPFAIDVDNFRFTPRVQRINELGIHTRLRLQFSENVCKFWTLQGIQCKVPYVGGKLLDLYALHDGVKQLGGYLEVCKQKQWTHVCAKLGLAKSFSGVIHKHYEKILHPFDMMKSGLSVEVLESDEKRDFIASLLKVNNKKKKATMYKGSDLDFDLDFLTLTSNDQPTHKPRKKRQPAAPLVGDVANNKELAKLQIFGTAGPKLVGLGVAAQKEVKVEVKEEPMDQSTTTPEPSDCDKNASVDKLPETGKEADEASPNGSAKDEDSLESADKNQSEKTKVQTRHRGKDQIPYSMIDSMDNCKVCGKDNNETVLLMCDGCDDNYHTYCLIPQLPTRPTGGWRCPKCIAKECNKKTQAYGFEQARKEYTLHSFGEMADAFKSEYFSKPTHNVSPQEVEREFWRLVGSLEEDLTVEYGADIHVIEHGSGFPRVCDGAKRTLSREEEEYAQSGWNLNNLPILEQSLLRSISGDISGMKVPWVYVGMCFSAFCWHIEDHWTYSINYMHWGEPKTWYGIPREDAGKFEEVMQKSAPELFNSHPDLLHHLVTTMNPATLMRNGVRVVRTNQCAGEFMITFPRAYHAGFNQGYNFAEAVNFCPADWVPVGRMCIEHYRKMRKCCVFSHEEIVCKVALGSDSLDAELAGIIYNEMAFLVEQEEALRRSLKELGVEKCEREAFECVPDDERQCSYCNTTVFLSALSCPCFPDRLVCLHHLEQLCDKCPPSSLTLRYRYQLNELPPILEKLKGRSQVFEEWKVKVEKCFNVSLPKVKLDYIQDLLSEAEEESFPENELHKRLKSLSNEAVVCSKVAQQLIKTWNPKLEAPLHSSNASKLEFREMIDFQNQLGSLRCHIDLYDDVNRFIASVKLFVDKCEAALSRAEPVIDEVERLLHASNEFQIGLHQLPRLQDALQQAKWLKEVRRKMGFSIDSEGKGDIPTILSKNHPFITIEELRNLIEMGNKVSTHLAVEHTMKELRRLISVAEAWEDKCTTVLNSRTHTSLKEASNLLSSSRELPVHLPNAEKLYKMVEKAKNWEKKAKKILLMNFYPYMHELEELMEEVKTISFSLDYVDTFADRLRQARSWLERTVKTFAKKHETLELIQILSPRDESDMTNIWLKHRTRKRSSSTDQNKEFKNQKLDTDLGSRDLTEIIDNFFEAEKTEMRIMKKFRAENDEKVVLAAKPAGKSDNDDPMNGSTSSNDNESIVYCICRKGNRGFMLQCELCHEWFHQDCVTLPKFCSGRNKHNSAQVSELKFLCPLCQRSRRPTISEVLTLLLDLQKIPVRIREGEALQFLAERAVRWQHKARDMLSKTECKALMDRVRQASNMPKSENEESPHKSPRKTVEKTEASPQVKTPPRPIIKKELSEKDNPLYEAAETLLVLGRTSTTTNSSAPLISNNNDTERNSSSPDLECYEEIDSSTPTKTSHNQQNENGSDDKIPCSLTPIKKEIKTEACNNLVTLSDATKLKLEEIQFEGDLIEISLTESMFIWKILVASNPKEKLMQQEDSDDDEDDSASVTIKSDKNLSSPLHKQQETSLPTPQRSSLDKSSKKKKKETPEPKRKKRSSKGSINDSPTDRNREKTEKKRRKREEKQKALIVRAKAASSNMMDDDENAVCSARLSDGSNACKQPHGDRVDWVQCDGLCQEWFHCACVGISAHEAAAASIYRCQACKNVSSSSSYYNDVEMIDVQ